MKQFQEMELDDYRVYLQSHLRDHHFPEFDKSDFIETRVNAAYEAFTNHRLAGRNVMVAQELAMRTLLDGYYVSRWDVIYRVLEEELWLRVSEEDRVEWADFFVDLRFVNKILDRYEVNGDFLEKGEYASLTAELLTLFNEILDDNELQSS